MTCPTSRSPDINPQLISRVTLGSAATSHFASLLENLTMLVESQAGDMDMEVGTYLGHAVVGLFHRYLGDLGMGGRYEGEGLARVLKER